MDSELGKVLEKIVAETQPENLIKLAEELQNALEKRKITTG